MNNRSRRLPTWGAAEKIEQTTVVFLHEKSTASEGWQTFFGAAATVLGMGVFQYFFFPHIWAEDKTFVFIFIAIECVVFGLVFCYAFVNIRSDTVFRCVLTTTKIACTGAASGSGDNFVVNICNIDRVEIEDQHDSPRYYLWDNTGRKYWLTTNYGNPANKFTDHITILMRKYK